MPPAPPPPPQHTRDFGFPPGEELDSSDRAMLNAFLGKAQWNGLACSKDKPLFEVGV